MEKLKTKRVCNKCKEPAKIWDKVSGGVLLIVAWVVTCVVMQAEKEMRNLLTTTIGHFNYSSYSYWFICITRKFVYKS